MDENTTERTMTSRTQNISDTADSLIAQVRDTARAYLRGSAVGVFDVATMHDASAILRASADMLDNITRAASDRAAAMQGKTGAWDA